MVNLRSVANSVTKRINPNILSFLETSIGFSQDASFNQVAQFADPVQVFAQVQDLKNRDLRLLDGVNLQGNEVAIYLTGTMAGAVRVTQQGGDVITIPTSVNAGVYLVIRVLEQWQGDWVKVAAQLQNQDVADKINGLDFSDPDNSQFLPGGTPA